MKGIFFWLWPQLLCNATCCTFLNSLHFYIFFSGVILVQTLLTQSLHSKDYVITFCFFPGKRCCGTSASLLLPPLLQHAVQHNCSQETGPQGIFLLVLHCAFKVYLHSLKCCTEVFLVRKMLKICQCHRGACDLFHW